MGTFSGNTKERPPVVIVSPSFTGADLGTSIRLKIFGSFPSQVSVPK